MNNLLKYLAIILLFVPITIFAQNNLKSTISETNEMKIEILFGKSVVTATMDDNPATIDFLKMLPLTLMLKDYANTEKIAYLPQNLILDKAPPGSDPSIGDITYYSPWGNLAIFYKDYSYSSGLIKIGKVDSGIELLSSYSGKIIIRKYQKK